MQYWWYLHSSSCDDCVHQEVLGVETILARYRRVCDAHFVLSDGLMSYFVQHRYPLAVLAVQR
jgi:hypothetical protein